MILIDSSPLFHSEPATLDALERLHPRAKPRNVRRPPLYRAKATAAATAAATPPKALTLPAAPMGTCVGAPVCPGVEPVPVLCEPVPGTVITSVVLLPMGQLVTVGGHDVMVRVVVMVTSPPPPDTGTVVSLGASHEVVGMGSRVTMSGVDEAGWQSGQTTVEMSAAAARASRMCQSTFSRDRSVVDKNLLAMARRVNFILAMYVLERVTEMCDGKESSSSWV